MSDAMSPLSPGVREGEGCPGGWNHGELEALDTTLDEKVIAAQEGTPQQA